MHIGSAVRWRWPGHAAPPRSVQVLVVALALQVLVFSVSTVPGIRTTREFIPLLDGWLQGAAYATAAALAVVPLGTSAAGRTVWRWFAGAVALRALGFVLFLGVVRWQQPRSVPSVADLAWLAMYAAVLGGLVSLARIRARRWSVPLVLDGLVGALAASAVVVTLLYPTLRALSVPGTRTAELVVDLAYPVLDLAVIVVLVGVLVAFEWRPPPAVWGLAAGTAGFAVIDTVYVYQSATDTFRPGTPLPSGALAAMVLVALAGSLPQAPRPAPREPLPSVVVSAVFALVCLGVLVFATRAHGVPVLGVGLSGAGVAAAIALTGLSFRAVRAVAQHQREARTDELTGLPNRRAFNEALERVLAAR